MLDSLELSNGELAQCETLAHFLHFMKSISAPVPISGDELDPLLTSYIKQVRREQMQYVSDLRVSRGESPLPRKLTGTPSNASLKATIRKGQYSSPEYIAAVTALREIQDKEHKPVKTKVNRGWKR